MAHGTFSSNNAVNIHGGRFYHGMIISLNMMYTEDM